MAYNPLIKGEPDWHVKMNENMAGLEADIGKAKTAAVEEANTHADAAANKVKLGKNLLDNWYFANPVDQRQGLLIAPGVQYHNPGDGTQVGVTDDYYKVVSIASDGTIMFSIGGVMYGTYPENNDVPVRGYVDIGYTIDRWRAMNTFPLVYSKDGVRLIMKASQQFKQILNNYSILDGQFVTASILFADNTLETGSFKFNEANTSWDSATFFYAKNIRVLMTASSGFTFYSNEVDVDVTIKAIKVELGTVQTLAHNEGTEEEPIWVLNEIPNYSEELLKCIQSTADPEDTYANKVIATGYLCNKNLLDNWYFGNPVDQKVGYIIPPGTPCFGDAGLTQYISPTAYYRQVTKRAEGYCEFLNPGVGYFYAAPDAVIRGYTNDGYGIDRWCAVAGGNSYRLTNDGLYMERTGQYSPVVRQLIPLDEGLKGKEVTISFIGSESTEKAIYMHLYVASGINGNMTQLCSTRVNSAATVTIPVNETRPYLLVGFDLSSGNTATIRACKLELGSSQTLAHQDKGGNWVLNEIPDYAEELAKCQRYFIRVANKTGGTSVVAYGAPEASSGTILMTIPVPVTMRATPVVTAVGMRVRIAGGSYVNLADIKTVSPRNNVNSVQVGVTTSTDITSLTNNMLTVALYGETQPAYIDIDANL